MPKADLPLSQKPYTSPLQSLGAEIVNNYNIENAGNMTAKAKYYYIGIPGLHLWSAKSSTNYPSSNACRLLHTTTNGLTYGVFGKYVVKINSNTTQSVIGTLNTNSGIVRAVDNGDTILLVDGSYGYTISTNNNILSQITEEGFPGIDNTANGPSHCACIDTYFIVNSRGTNSYYWSAPGYVPYAFDSTQPGNLTLWNALDVGQKIGDSDFIVGIIALINLMFVFGNDTTEIHYNLDTGDNSNGQIFGRMDNALLNVGCSAPDSICKYLNTVYWIGSDKTGTIGIFASDTSFQPRRISTRGVETRIQAYANIADCYSFVYAHNGHAFIVFQFPSGTPTDDSNDQTGATWVYDIITDTWTIRTHWSGVLSSAWKGNSVTSNYGKILIGSNTSNALWYLDSNYYMNDSEDGTSVYYIKRELTSPIEYDAGKNNIYSEVQLNFQQGQGLGNVNFAGIGADPQVAMQYSNDSGYSWSNMRYKSIGLFGRYGFRTRWTKCGFGRNRVWKFIITEPVFVAILGIVVTSDEAPV